MDPSRIESYLRSTCSVLDFDIGEIWCARKLPGQEPALKFIQLYTSPTYDDFHSLLVQPENSTDPNHGFGLDEEKHQFSPIICRGVCDGGHIVWANTRISEGLTGRTDLPLNTAVGVPICSIGNDLYMLVLFAVGLISMTPQAVEYLTTIARAVTEGSNGFLSASFSSDLPVTPAKTEDFVGIWDINELVRKYSTEVEFHVFPVGKLQKFFDCHEILLFCDLFMDFKLTRDGRFTVKQLESLRESFHQTRERSDSADSDASKGWDIDSDFHFSADSDTTKRKDTSSSMTHQKNPFATGLEMDIGHGVYSADLNSLDLEENENNAEGSRPYRSVSMDISESNDVGKSILHIYAHMTYKLGQCRFHEFMIAVLGMTVFEASELWLVNERKGDLQLVAAVYRTVEMQQWIALSETLRLKVGVDLPGRVVDTGTSHWESNYCKSSTDESDCDLRTKSAQKLGVNVAFAVPLPGLRGICGSVVFYSSRKDFTPSSLLMMLIEKAVHLMAVSSVDNTIFPKLPSPHHSSSDLQKIAAAAADGIQNNQVSSVIVNSNSSGNLWNARNLVRGRSVGDFDQRVELCRSIVNSRASNNGEISLNNSSKHPMARKRNSSGRLKQLGAIAAAAVAAEELQEVDGPSLPPGFVFTPITGNPPSIQTPFFPPQVDLNAAFAVSQFGSVGWRNFIPADYHFNPAGPNIQLSSSHNIPVVDHPTVSIMQESCAPYAPSVVPSNVSNFIPIVSGNNSISARFPFVNGVVTDLSRQNLIPLEELGQRMIHLCKMEGCAQEIDSSGGQYCTVHRTSRRCQKEGCNKCAQGATKYCIAHGGGRRCTFPGCEKGARDKFFCAAHGGGKRCSSLGCTKSAVGGSNLCTAHGGGKRCQHPGCQKSSQSSTNYCVRHGGGRTCNFRDCTKVARGKTEFCASHGGGVRCRVIECNKLALGARYLCRAHTAQFNNNPSAEELVCVPIGEDHVGQEPEDEDEIDNPDDDSNEKVGDVGANDETAHIKRRRVS